MFGHGIFGKVTFGKGTFGDGWSLAKENVGDIFSEDYSSIVIRHDS